MVLLKKFLIALAVTVYAVAPVFAGDSDRVRGHWQGQSAKMLNLKAHQQNAWGHLKRAHLEGMRASVRDLRLPKKRPRIAFQSGAGEEGLIAHYKREYQIATGRSLTRHQRPLMGAPRHRFWSTQSKGSGKNWGQGHGKNSNKRYGLSQKKGAGMRWKKCSGKTWGKGCNQSWEQGYGKKSNKRHGMRGDKGAGKCRDRSRGDEWQKYRKKKSFDSD